MTRDAFYKAQELEKKLDAVHQMQNIIANSSLSSRVDYDKPHNDHVIKDEMILGYFHKPREHMMSDEADIIVSDNISDNLIRPMTKGSYHMGGNYIHGRDIPVELSDRLSRVLNEYEREIEKQFDELDGEYVKEDLFD